MQNLKLSDILSANDLEVEAIDVPEWGGRVFVHGLSGNARDEINQRMDSGESLVGLRALIASRGLCDEDGTEWTLTVKQVHELGEKSAGVLERIVDRIQDLSGLTDESRKELEKTRNKTRALVLDPIKPGLPNDSAGTATSY